MSKPATVHDFVAANTALTQLSYSALSNVPEFEAGSYEHWVFDKGDAQGLVGRINGRALAVQSTAPTYNAKSLVLGTDGAAYQKGLLTALDDTAEFTVCAVFKWSSTPKLVFGTVDASNGSALIVAGSSPAVGSFVRGPSSTTRGIVMSPGPSSGDFIFAALGISLSGAHRTRRYYVSGQSFESTDDSAAETVSSRKFAFGDAYYNNVTYNNSVELAEASIFTAPLSLAQMAAVYKRAKVRMARRSITIA